MLTSVTLENFKRHKKLHVDLRPGVNVIVGRNYAGKTTILEAISYAFIGPTAVEGGNAVIQNEDGGETKVVLNFEAQGKDWILTRKQNTASLVSDADTAETEATGTTGVNSRLQELFGIDKKLFLILTHSVQNEAAMLLKEGDAKLNQMMERLSGVDMVDRVLNSLRDRMRVAKAVLEEIGLPDQKEIELSSASAEKAKADIGWLEGQLQALAEKMRTANEEAAAAEKSYDRLLAKKKQQADLVTTRNRLTSQIEQQEVSLAELRDDLSKLSDHSEEADALQEEADRMASRHAKLTKLNYDRDTCVRAASSAQQKVHDLRQEVVALNQRAETLRKERDTLPPEAEAEHTVDQYNQLVDVIDNLAASLEEGFCKACGRPYEEAGDVDQLRAELKEAEEKRLELQPTAVDADAAIERHGIISAEILRAQEKADDCDSRLASAEMEEEQQQKTLAYVEQQIKQLQDEGAPDEEAVSAARKAAAEAAAATKQYHQARERLDGREAALLGLREELGALPDVGEIVSDEQLDGQRRALSALQAEERNAAAEHSNAGTLKTTAEADLEFHVKRLKELESRRERYEAKAAEIDRMARLSKFLRTNRTQLLSSVWTSVLAQASTVVSLITGGAVERVSRAEGKGLSYFESGQERPVAAASGCQRAVIGVAVRAAIAKIFQGDLKFMLLDEISADMDAEHVSATMSVLERLNSQIVYITHSSEELRDEHNLIEL